VERLHEVRGECLHHAEVPFVIRRSAKVGFLVHRQQSLSRLAILRQQVLAHTLEQHLRHGRRRCGLGQ
jgi:hypothetical protein